MNGLRKKVSNKEVGLITGEVMEKEVGRTTAQVKERGKTTGMKHGSKTTGVVKEGGRTAGVMNTLNITLNITKLKGGSPTPTKHKNIKEKKQIH